MIYLFIQVLDIMVYNFKLFSSLVWNLDAFDTFLSLKILDYLHKICFFMYITFLKIKKKNFYT